MLSQTLRDSKHGVGVSSATIACALRGLTLAFQTLARICYAILGKTIQRYSSELNSDECIHKMVERIKTTSNDTFRLLSLDYLIIAESPLVFQPATKDEKTLARETSLTFHPLYWSIHKCIVSVSAIGNGDETKCVCCSSSMRIDTSADVPEPVHADDGILCARNVSL